MLVEIGVAERRYQAALAVIEDGLSATEAAAFCTVPAIWSLASPLGAFF
ncbi:MAG: hypothetical protein ACM3ML_27960 [Micromonosporaceae bacterium]